jgi:hypothetical protein
MKPLHIVLLIAAGALGGAVVMKVSERTRSVAEQRQTAAAAPLVAQAPVAPAPAATPVPAAPVPAPIATTPVEDRPSPLSPPREMPKPGRTHTRRQPTPPAQPSSPVAVAHTPTPAPAISPAPEPVAPAPAPQPDPPARPEPEHVTPPPAPPAPPEPHKVTLNAGTLIPVRLVDGLTSERNVPGDLFTATLDKPLVVDGFAIAERGARVEGRVVASDRGGRVRGVASLAVEITRLRLSDGQTVSLSTDSFERRAEASRGDDAAKVGAGAAIGAVIGAIAGGGKGAAIGAGAGGAAGAGTVMATRGRAAALPSETRISFRLRAPVEITEKL